MKRILIISLFVFLLFSCDNKFPEYNQKEEGVYMELLSFDEDNKGSESASYAYLSIEITDKKKLIYKHYKEEVIKLENNELAFLIQYLKEGDSCSFMVSKEKVLEIFKHNFFSEDIPDYVEVTMKIHQYLTKEEQLSQQKGSDKEMTEQLILNKYLNEVEVISIQGIYKEKLVRGEGEKVKKGDVITISYKGYFINRLQFDEISGTTAFTFTYGVPDQVIKGLDIAINGMQKGEKSKIIIPSQLAFGEGGSSTNVVPPFTTVIYELEIVNVK